MVYGCNFGYRRVLGCPSAADVYFIPCLDYHGRMFVSGGGPDGLFVHRLVDIDGDRMGGYSPRLFGTGIPSDEGRHQLHYYPVC